MNPADGDRDARARGDEEGKRGKRIQKKNDSQGKV